MFNELGSSIKKWKEEANTEFVMVHPMSHHIEINNETECLKIDYIKIKTLKTALNIV